MVYTPVFRNIAISVLTYEFLEVISTSRNFAICLTSKIWFANFSKVLWMDSFSRQLLNILQILYISKSSISEVTRSSNSSNSEQTYGSIYWRYSSETFSLGLYAWKQIFSIISATSKSEINFKAGASRLFILCFSSTID